MSHHDYNKSRRAFMTKVASGVGALTTFSLVPWNLESEPSIIGKSLSPKEVIVIGAGLSGLAAAWELKQAGHKVTVLEARSVAGGRVKTLKQPFADGLTAEAGGYMFSEAYSTANKLIGELGLIKKPVQFPTGGTAYYLAGKRMVASANSNVLPFGLTNEEAQLGPFGLVKKYIIDTLPTDISNPDNWSNPEVLALDKMSVTQYLKKQGASQGVIDLLKTTQYYATAPDKTSMLAVAKSDFGLFMGGAPFMLEGGNDSLPLKMAEKMNDIIHYGVQVTHINSSADGVSVKANRAGHEMNFNGKYIICTLPCTVMRGVKFEPGLSSGKKKAIEEYPYLKITRAYAQVSNAYWKKDDVGGMAYTDKSAFVYTHPTYKSFTYDDRCILEAYMDGDESIKVGKMAKDGVIGHALNLLNSVQPGLMDYYEGGAVKDWTYDPFSLGGPSWAGPGDMSAHLSNLQSPEGRIFFAGEHTTVLRSTMEGALRSGIRAAKNVNDA
ncbi:flavin monoamine oxidase family protein [Marinigracilibium pacificum]|uniref:Tryptophan 2-monooxygenase n=1 Tax=Marinigracilibium pacificum TaxID=2729599 RepID=A0A848IW13_9BACT|nr:FAD-dependent oxidoreductase [Marinigracilibium pacificum]NMM48527.1 FAD-dependent oxidoreductase [Marinigracilibium pacificum]